MKKVLQTMYLAMKNKFRFVNKDCKLESQALSFELKKLEKVQRQKDSDKSPTNQ